MIYLGFSQEQIQPHFCLTILDYWELSEDYLILKILRNEKQNKTFPLLFLLKWCKVFPHWRMEWQTTSVFFSWEPHKQEKIKRYDTPHNTWHKKDEIPRSEGAQYATRKEWRNNSRKNEEMEPNQKQHPVLMWRWWM